MSDPIAPTGSLGQGPPGAIPIPTMPATPSSSLEGREAASQASATAVAAAKASRLEAPEASKLELSQAASAQPAAVAAPKAMNVQEAAQAFQEYLKNLPSDLQFQPDASSGIVVFKVINPITQKVLRQYPPEEMLEMARSLKQSLKKEASGILLDHNL